MFFPISFWIWAGDLACEPSRNRRRHAPLPDLSEEETASLVGRELCAPFVPDPFALDAYRRASRIALSLDDSILNADDLRTHAHNIFRANNAAELRVADEQWSISAAAIGEITHLLNSQAWQLPISTDVEPVFPELPMLKRLNFVLQLRAAALWVREDEAGAIEHLKTAYALGLRLQDCGGLFIHELVGTSCKSRISRLIRTGARSRPLSEPSLQQLNALFGEEDLVQRMRALFDREFRFSVIPSARFRGEPWRPTDRAKRKTDLTQTVVAQQLLVEWSVRNHKMPLDRRQTVAEIGKSYGAILLELNQGWAVVGALNSLAEKYGAEFPAEFKTMFLDSIFGIPPTTALAASAAFNRRENPFGKLALYKLFYMSARMVASSYRSLAEQSATRIGIAAVRMRGAGAGGPLTSLYTLVNAGYLDEIPKDPITTLPFRLDEQTQSVWLPGPKNLTFAQAYESRTDGRDSWWWALP